MFLAQGPGPKAQPPDIQNFGLQDIAVESIPASEFARSWEDAWHRLQGDDGSLMAPATMNKTPVQNGSNHPPPSFSSNDTRSEDKRSPAGLSAGATSGISIAAALTSIAIASGLLYLFLRRKKKKQNLKNSSGQSEPGLDQDMHAQPGPHEMYAASRRTELGRSGLPHEAQGRALRELYDGRSLPELPP